MPPKGGAEPAASPMEDLIERQEAVTDILDFILCRVNEGIDESNFRRRFIADVVKGAVVDSLDIIDLALLHREDTALNTDLVSKIGSNWVADEEPENPAIDTWARGVLPFKRKPLPPPTPTESVGGRSKAGSTAYPKRKGGGQSTVGDEEKSMRESQRQALQTKSVAVPSTMLRPKKKVSAQEAAVEERLREEIEVRQQQKEAARLQHLKDSEDREKLALLQKDLRGEDYVYNYKGEVVPVAKFDPDRLPPSSVSAITQMAPLYTEEELLEMEREKKAAANTRRDKKKPAPKKVPSVFGEPQRTFVPDETKRQVSLLDHMKVEGGVTLREGSSSKAGPKREGSTNATMTRSEYLASIGASDAILDGTESRAASRAGARTPGTPQPKGAAVGGGGGMAGDFDNRPGTAQSTLLEAMDVKPLVDVNDKLTQAPDWGQNPPPRVDFVPASYPHDKVTVKDRELTLGSIPRFPRERPYIPHLTEHELLPFESPPMSPTTSGEFGAASPAPYAVELAPIASR